MAYRVLARFDDQTIRTTLEEGRNLIGSDPECEICLQNPTVSRRHAALMIGETVELEDLGSTNGTLLGSQRIEQPVKVDPGDVFIVGRVVVLLEEIIDEDLEVGITLSDTHYGDAPEEEEKKGEVTQSFSPLDRFTLDQLPRLLRQLHTDHNQQAVAERVGNALIETMPVSAVEILVADADPDGEREEQGEDDDSSAGVLFTAERSTGVPGDAHWTELSNGGFTLRAAFISERTAEHYRPVVESAGLMQALCRKEALNPPDPMPKSRAERPQPPSVDQVVRDIYDQAERVARGDVGVMIFGESGTGKEVLAGFLHVASPRASKNLVTINCASLPRDLLEAELFGIEKGVATGVEARPGKFEAADGGTLFLDEIGDMAPETQAKILRVLQERMVYRIGGHTPRSAEARIVAATNRPIHDMIADGSFRNDLYHRIATWEVELPPLRQRRGDIANLSAHFLHQEAERYGIRARGISRAALRMLRRYRWPGNIRQLRNEIARAALFLENGELLDTTRLSAAIKGEQDGRQGGNSLTEILESVERDEILSALESSGGDTAKAAEALQISRPTLYRRIKSLGIEVSSS